MSQISNNRKLVANNHFHFFLKKLKATEPQIKMMNPKTLVKASNIIGIISITLLVFWVFIFMTVEVFELRVFRENITETFYMSIFAILALMFGALIINIMFNLTRIAQKHNNDAERVSQKMPKTARLALILIFPIVLGLLFGGDYLSSKNREKLLIESAKSIISDHPSKVQHMLNYSFTKNWVDDTGEALDILSRMDASLPHVSVIVNDSLYDSNLYLRFTRRYSSSRSAAADTTLPTKKQHILETTKPERDYLNQVFDANSTEIRFSAHDGNYELFYPFIQDDKIMVLYFSDFKRYGKIGS